MKSLNLILLLSCLASFAYSQSIIEEQKQRLLTEIRKCDYIESYCLGLACNSHSVLYKKADSLFALSITNDAITYFNDTSYSLKYYSFLHLLDLNDTLAFELLKRNISDSGTIDYTFADMSSNTKIIYLLVNEYRDFIKAKYLFGGRAMMSGHRFLSFPPANKSIYKSRSKELERLLKTNNIVFK